MTCVKGDIIRFTFVRFVLVGVLNTIFGAAVYSVALFVGCSYVVATLISNVLGVIFNFKTIGTMVFDSHDNRLIWKFVICYVLAFLLQLLLIKLLLTVTPLNKYWCGYIAMPMVALFSYFFQKDFVYKKNKE